MLKDQYETVPYEQFSGPIYYERLRTINLLLRREIFNGLLVELGVSSILWTNAGFDPFNSDPNSVRDVEKTSFVVGFSYNFSYPGRNRVLYD